MNLLNPVLRTANAGAVVATIRAFLSIADAAGRRAGDDRDPDSPSVDVRGSLTMSIGSFM